jgi:purine nucleosidase
MLVCQVRCIGTLVAALFAVVAVAHRLSPAASSADAANPPAAQVIIDTDIGDDIDDAFAVSLALDSPELEIQGITTAWGDTSLRARLVERLLNLAGRASIPVAQGIVTRSKVPFTQARWAGGGPEPRQQVDAVDFLLRQIRNHPGEITLVTIAPLTNIAAAIDRDPETFRKVKRVVMMGGSIRRGYDGTDGQLNSNPDPEYNVASDVGAARKLLSSGVPIFMMPLDSTQLRLDQARRRELFASGTPLASALAALYGQWGRQTPVLYDAMAVAYVIDPQLCPVRPLHVEVDERGYTRPGPGTANVSACLASDADQFFGFLMPRLERPLN